jgi:SpoVK/Ycf46/Vps4 family AAA+-type ATPase
VKRIYIPLPETATRQNLFEHLLGTHQHSLGARDFKRLVSLTDGYSCSDLSALAREASLGPIRELGSQLMTAPVGSIRPISLNDFENALKIIRKSVSPSHLSEFEAFRREYGTGGV